MVYQMIQYFPWRVIFMSVGVVLIAVAIVTAALSMNKPGRLKVSIIVAMIVMGFGCLGGESMVSKQQDIQNDASFSKQLMDEYHVTSSRSFHDLDADFTRLNEANTVFTKDGKETPVFIKLLRKNDKMIIMDFTVIDDKALYPKANQ